MPETSEEQAYRILSTAAERVGRNNYASQLTAHVKAGKSRRTFRFTVTDAHAKLVQAMADLGRSKITPEEAVAVIHYDYDINQQRFAGR